MRAAYFNPLMEARMSLTQPGPHEAENTWRKFGEYGPPDAICVECRKPCSHWSDAYCQECARRIVGRAGGEK